MPKGVYNHYKLRGKNREFTKQWRENIGKSVADRYKRGEKFGFQKGHKDFLTQKQHKEINQLLRGQKRTEEVIQKIVDSKKNISDETRKKMGESHSGEKCHFWKGGITPENKKIRRSIEFRLWREAVFARDNFTCQRCEVRNGNGKTIYLHPHHIKNFAQWKDLRFAIDNGITFCNDCHKEFHKKYGKEDNTREQVEEFLIYDRERDNKKYTR